MRAIAVDDEQYMLETLREAVTNSPDIESVNSFSSCSAAIEYIRSNPVDVAFLDINMRGIGGLALAEKIMEIQPECKIVFCTGYEEYAVTAFRMHVSGYLVKPVTAEDVQKEINHIKGGKSTGKLLKIQCFGDFEIFKAGGETLQFKRKKTKELLAVLVDRKGSGVTAKHISALLFSESTDETKNMTYIRQLVLDLKKTLKSANAEMVLCHETPYYRIDTGMVECDYFDYLNAGKPDFYGEYMTQYSWAESTCAMLQNRKK